jgi:FkbM family methyltransferase
MGPLGHLVSLFIRLGCRGRLARLLLMLPFRALRSRYGPLLANVRGDRTFRFCATGAYGEFIAERLRKTGKEFAFFDIGANVGVFSLVAAGNPQCRAVYAFEPNPLSYAFLVRNIQLNRATKATPFCAALTRRGGACSELWIPDRHSGRASLSRRIGSGATHLVLNADRELLNCLARRISVDVVAKIDVEGHEPVVLGELLNSDLRAKLTDVIVELSYRRNAERAEETVRLLEEAGFELADRNGPREHSDAHFTRRRDRAPALFASLILPATQACPAN